MHQPIFNHLPVQRTKHLGNLPLDIQFAILQLCSPSDLAEISQVHSSLQAVAECALYSHIRFCVPPLEISLIPDDDSVPSESDESFLLLLRTFSGNPRKASMVKKLYVKLETERMYDIESKAVGYLLVKLADALEKMNNLVDLRIIYRLGVDLAQERISEVIRGGHFILHTLYLEQSHDLEGIITDQPQIRILAFYYPLAYPVAHIRMWKKIEGLYRSPARRRTMPTIFGIDGSFRAPQINLLPAFNRPKETLRVCKEIDGTSPRMNSSRMNSPRMNSSRMNSPRTNSQMNLMRLVLCMVHFLFIESKEIVCD
ncbi:hypothetical protein F5887DRAFT_976921 [Amanita rubescens]|nr:hypothetical protein F5887DRAFT_976921 [Amanita rubescens]